MRRRVMVCILTKSHKIKITIFVFYVNLMQIKICLKVIANWCKHYNIIRINKINYEPLINFIFINPND